MREQIRTVRLAPYRPGQGPTFYLTTYDTGRTDDRGCTRQAYTLTQHEPGKAPIVLFDGEDFCGSPLHADDSDQTIAALLGFLTLRPGDTDQEYFDRYTPDQIRFCEDHAETLACEAISRFGED
jgi:hypothetical protein